MARFFRPKIFGISLASSLLGALLSIFTFVGKGESLLVVGLTLVIVGLIGVYSSLSSEEHNSRSS